MLAFLTWVRRLLRWPGLPPLLIGLFALSIRLGYNAVYIGPGYLPEADAFDYSSIAANLASGQGFRLPDGALTASRPPLFPLVLGGVYRLFGVNYGAGLVLQALLGAGVTAAVFAVGKRVYGLRAGWLAGLIAATYPPLIYASGFLLSEPLFILAVTLTMVAGLRVLARPRPGNYALLGLFLGLCWLIRPNGALLIPFVLAWLLSARPARWWGMAGGFLLVLLIVGTMAAPWIIRNYAAFGEFIPTTTMGGTALLGAYNERVVADPALHGDWISPCALADLAWTCRLDEISRDTIQQVLALRFIQGNLPELPRMLWWRFVNFWHLYPFSHGFPANIGFYYYAFVAVLAVLGLFVKRANWQREGGLVAIVVCFMTIGLLFWADFRIRAPAEPALILLAAGALDGLARRHT